MRRDEGRDLREFLDAKHVDVGADQGRAAVAETVEQPASKRRAKSARELQRSADRLAVKVAAIRERLLNCKLREVLLRAMKKARPPLITPLRCRSPRIQDSRKDP